MAHLNLMRARAGLNYRRLEAELREVAPEYALGRSALQTLFTRSMVPASEQQVKAIVTTLLSSQPDQELSGSGAVEPYLAAWQRLIGQRTTRQARFGPRQLLADLIIAEERATAENAPEAPGLRKALRLARQYLGALAA